MTQFSFRQQSSMLDASIWNELAVFESADLVSTLHTKRHSETPDKFKARSIAALFTQAREYFSSATQSSEIIRPLVIYYGVMALARGLILFLNPDCDVTRTDFSHGLHAHAWDTTLSSDKNDILTLQIALSKGDPPKGTFAELCRAFKNVERTTVPVGPHDRLVKWEKQGTFELPREHVFTLKDIVSRIPHLHGLYEAITNECSNCIRTTLFAYEKPIFFHIHLFPSAHGCIEDARLREAFSLAPEDKIKSAKLRFPLGTTQTAQITKYFMTSEEFIAKHPHARGQHGILYNIDDEAVKRLQSELPTLTDNGTHSFFIVPERDGVHLSTLSRLYLVSYTLGMLVRYHPAVWFSITRAMENDRTLPLLRAASNLIETEYPKLILTELRI